MSSSIIASMPTQASFPMASILLAGMRKPWRPVSGSSMVNVYGIPRLPFAQSSLPPKNGETESS